MFFFLIDAALAVGGVLLLIQQYQTGFQGAKKSELNWSVACTR
jgi:hypothetical protein